MKPSKGIASLTALALLSLPFTASASEGPGATYDQLVLVTKSGKRIEARLGKVGAAEISAQSSAGAPISVPLGDIKTLYVAEGTQAGTMALCGAGVGLVLGLAALRTSLDETATLGFIGALTGGGALIGGLIGSQMVQWRVQPVVDPGKQYALQLSLAM